MKPLISYYGGKQRMAKWIISHFPDHSSYIEPFCGGAAVFFAKDLAHLNVLNDMNGEVVNLYRQAKLHPEELFALIDATPHSRSEYRRAEDIYKGRVEADELTRAWAMYTATMQAFGDKTGAGWAYQKNGRLGGSSRRINNKKLTIPPIFDRLGRAQIDNIDALDCITRYDNEDALFYIDPPYVDTGQGHYKGYTQEHFNTLLDLLTTLKGAFFLSHYANSSMESIASRNNWRTLSKEAVCTVGAGLNGGGARNKRVELLVTNYII